VSSALQRYGQGQAAVNPWAERQDWAVAAPARVGGTPTAGAPAAAGWMWSFSNQRGIYICTIAQLE